MSGSSDSRRALAAAAACLLGALVWPAVAQTEVPKDATAPAEDCGFLCQMSKAVSDGAKQGMGGKSFGEAVSSGVQDRLAGKQPQVLGHVNMGNGNYLTFFDNNPGGFPSTGRPLAVPPRPGTVPPPMALVPVNVKNGISTEGALLANNIDEMKKRGVFVAAAPAAAAAAGNAGRPADEASRSVPRIFAIHNGKKYQTSLHSCAVFDELGPDDQATGRQVSPNGALFDALGRCETRLSAFRRAQMDALEQEAQARGRK